MRGRSGTVTSAAFIAALALAIFPAVPASAVAASGKGTWGTAIEVPGLGALNGGGLAGVESVSCGSAGNCAAGGYYTDSSGDTQAFVAGQKSGTWGKAVELPGTATLNTGGSAAVNSVSCASAGNCGAGGFYNVRSGGQQALVASEASGTWGTALELPGTAGLNADGNAQVWAVSCRTAGNCAAGGYYTDGSGHTQAFVASQTSGTWGTAIEVPGTATLNAGGTAWVNSVSCASAGNCAAGGYYTDGSGHTQAFVASQTSGTWGTAIEVPGTATLNTGGNAELESLSCGSAGNCSAGGYYWVRSDDQQAFVVSEKNGTWGKAIEVPGSGTLNATAHADVYSVSCASAGNCSAGGTYADSSDSQQAFVVSENDGTWGKAIEVPGSGTLNTGGYAAVDSVSCASADHCAAGGTYTESPPSSQGFVASQT
jgi:hypothetical protein